MDNEKYKNYIITLLIVIAINIFGLIASIIWGITQTKNLNDGLIFSLSLLQITTFISSLLIFFLSVKNEATQALIHELASCTSRASSHEFKKFSTQIDFLEKFLIPARFESPHVNLYIALSTPIYGIGSCEDDSRRFLAYLEQWVALYEKLETQHRNRPTIQFAIWNKESNVNIFNDQSRTAQYHNKEEFNDSIRPIIEEYGKLLNRFVQLHKDGKIILEFFYTEKSDVRIFLASSHIEKKFRGLFTVFTPLTANIINNTNWSLTGFSFDDESTFEDTYNFYRQLICRGGIAPTEIGISIRKNPLAAILKHYNIK